MADFEIALNQQNSTSQARPAISCEGSSLPAPDAASGPTITGETSQSDLTRSVYCVLGMPIDAITMAQVVRKTEAAAANRSVFLISTPNLNFLVTSLSDREFRETLLNSDVCPPDGSPIVWIARLLGLPIAERAAGSDLLDQLQAREKGTRRLNIFLFGGAKGVAAAAANKLNAVPGGLKCVGTLDPGFCEVDEMSRDHTIEAVNSSGADFLAVSLGAKKGQLWLQRNHDRLTIPIRAHLGAAINFQAGIVKRAPAMFRAWGLEWLWRIKEEHYLWKRYRNDGLVLLRLLLTRVMPLAVMTRWLRFRRKHLQDLQIKKNHDDQSVSISLCGAASELHVPRATAILQEALGARQNIVIDLSNVSMIDARFFGLLIMLRKELKRRGANLTFTGLSRRTRRFFRLSELEYLLSPNPAG